MDQKDTIKKTTGNSKYISNTPVRVSAQQERHLQQACQVQQLRQSAWPERRVVAVVALSALVPDPAGA